MVESRKTQKVYAFCLRVGVQSCPGVARIERGGVVEGPSVRCTSRHPCLMEVSSGTSASRELSARLSDKGRQDDLAIEGAVQRALSRVRSGSGPMDKDVFMVKQAVTQASSASIGTDPPSRGRRRSPGGGLRRLLLVGAIATAVVAGAACNGGGDARPDQPSTSATQANETTSPSTSGNPSTTTSSSPDEAAAATAWRTLWNAATRQPGSEEAARKVADPAVVDRLLALTREPRIVTSSPTPTMQVDGIIGVTDCTFVSPTLSASATIGFVGSAAKQQDGTWRVIDLAPRNGQLQPCVPRSINDSAVSAYEDYWARRTEYFDPPAPDSPVIAQTTAEPQRSFNRDLVARYRDRGAALRGRPQTHPEIIEVRSPTEVVILDCQLQDPSRGLYDMKSGARLPDIAPMKEGQRDLRSTVMKMEDGRWKAADVQGNTEATCDYAPTTKGLPLL
jgi:hypothetical protein